jgi:hypothetical protein
VVVQVAVELDVAVAAVMLRKVILVDLMQPQPRREQAVAVEPMLLVVTDQHQLAVQVEQEQQIFTQARP